MLKEFVKRLSFLAAAVGTILLFGTVGASDAYATSYDSLTPLYVVSVLLIGVGFAGFKVGGFEE